MLHESLQSEWVLYDDAVVTSKGSLFEVISYCVEFSCYPTVLFFEKNDEPIN